ncbi:MAG: hypothetical protein ACJ8IK_03335 [Burkholderiaceae bacterium]
MRAVNSREKVERRQAGPRRHLFERQRLVELLLEPGDEVHERVGRAVHGLDRRGGRRMLS